MATESEDELQKKKRSQLPASSDHAEGIHDQLERYLKNKLSPIKDRCVSHLRAGLRGFGTATQDASTPPDDKALLAKSDLQKTEKTEHEQRLETHRKLMTEEQRQRHEKFVRTLPQPADLSASLKAAHVARFERESRQAAELAAIRTSLHNERVDRDHRVKERNAMAQGETRAHSHSELVRSQDQQQKDQTRQEILSRTSQDLPAESRHTIDTTRTHAQKRAEALERYRNAADQQDMSQKQSAGRGRGGRGR